MTRVKQPSAQTVTDAHAAGWIASLILHGALAFGAFAFTQQLKLVPQPTTFQWNVSTVASAPPMSNAPTTTAKQSTPAAQVPKSTGKTVPTKTEPIVQHSDPLSPIADHVTPPPVAEHSSRPVAEPPLPGTMETMEHDSSHPTSLPHVPAMSAPSLQTASASAESSPSTSDETIAAHTDTLSPEPATASTEPEIASLIPSSQNSSTKSDDGWLRDLMAKWTQDLSKHYPTMLRMEGIQGKVTVSALLHDDGILSDVRIAKSSGNSLLDQAAMEAVKSAPPVKLSRPLGLPSKPVKIPIAYVLSDAR